MESMLFEQLAFVRQQTLKALDGVAEDDAVRLPAPFRNHILWHAGHIYVVQERFALGLHGFDALIPEAYKGLFAPGTTPLDWTASPPTLTEVLDLLRGQQERIRSALRGRTGETAPSPYTTSSGLTLETLGAFLSFTLYHEGMHFTSIKHYRKLLGV